MGGGGWLGPAGPNAGCADAGSTATGTHRMLHARQHVYLHTCMRGTNAIDVLPQASKACETTAVQARRRDQGGSSGVAGSGKQFLGQVTAAVRT